MPKFESRFATEEDQEFLFGSYKATLKPYVEGAWGWNEDFQRGGFHKHHPLTQFHVITVDGERAGGMHVEEQETLNFIRLIFLLPRFQGGGIGADLIRREADRAKRANKQLHLKVIKINRAKSLYDRLGFAVIEEDAATYHMQFVAQLQH